MLPLTNRKYVDSTCLDKRSDAHPVNLIHNSDYRLVCFELVEELGTMRSLFLILLLAAVSLFTARSYITDFVVINESSQPVEVRYKIRNFPGAFTPPVAPATVATSQLSTKGNQQWNQLTSAEYQLDQESRTVIARVLPHHALRIATMHHYGGHEDSGDAQDFPVEEITILGADGERRFAAF